MKQSSYELSLMRIKVIIVQIKYYEVTNILSRG